jgi:hypothetical protein
MVVYGAELFSEDGGVSSVRWCMVVYGDIPATHTLSCAISFKYNSTVAPSSCLVLPCVP